MNQKIQTIREKFAAVQAAISARRTHTALPAGSASPLTAQQNVHLERLSKTVGTVHPGVGEAVMSEIEHDIDLFMKSLDKPVTAPPHHE